MVPLLSARARILSHGATVCRSQTQWSETSSQLYVEKSVFRITVHDQRVARSWSFPGAKTSALHTVSHKLKTERNTQTQTAFCRGLLLIPGKHQGPTDLALSSCEGRLDHPSFFGGHSALLPAVICTAWFVEQAQRFG